MTIRQDLFRLGQKPRILSRIVGNAVQHGTLLDLVRCRFPFRFPDLSRPHIIGIELTNACNLKCIYCDAQSPLLRGPTGMMSEQTFGRVVEQVRPLGVHSLRVIGSGEALMHPRFCEFVPKLAGAASVVSLTTNGQLLGPKNIATILDAFDFVEISVDSNNAKDYERLRVGASFDKLLENLKALRTERKTRGSRTLIQVRVMLRQSDLARVRELRAYWAQHADAVTTDRLKAYTVSDPDLFPLRTARQFRRCEAPFKLLDVNWNGDVPLCEGVEYQMGSWNGGIVLGNVNQTTLGQIWKGEEIRAYRQAHRLAKGEKASVCIGCPCVWAH